MLSLSVVTEQTSTFPIWATRNRENRKQHSVLIAKKKGCKRQVCSVDHDHPGVSPGRTTHQRGDQRSSRRSAPGTCWGQPKRLTKSNLTGGHTNGWINTSRHRAVTTRRQRRKTANPSCASVQRRPVCSFIFRLRPIQRSIVEKKYEKRTPSTSGSTVHLTKRNRCGMS